MISSFLGYKAVGPDGAKVGVLDDGGGELKRTGELLTKENRKDENYTKLAEWWTGAKAFADVDKKPVQEAGIFGGQSALKLTSYVPMTMAVLLLLLIIYFKVTGGYKALNVTGEQIAGGVEGPMEA